MRTLVHLSDIHFGRVDAEVIAPLIKAINELKPDLVAISGDLTQRARTREFKDAGAFLDALPRPQIVVPGNHDIPLYDVVSRFARPLDNYRRYVTDDLSPFYADDEIAVCGVNTARSLTIKGGRINKTQVAELRDRLCAFGPGVSRIIVTHHPFDLPDSYDERHLVGRARMAIDALADCRIDLFLAGHLHISHTGFIAKRYDIEGQCSLVVQAGTAASTRGRGEGNSFNVIRVTPSNIGIERLVWNRAKNQFVGTAKEEFRRKGPDWFRNS